MVGSLGGLQSASEILAGLPGDFPVPIVLLQHGSARPGKDVLAGLLGRGSTIAVATASDGQLLTGPGVAVVPRGHVATIEPGLRIRLAPTTRVGGGDVLMTSAAEVAGCRAMGVVLTGMLSDGTRGARAIKRHGGRVLAEDPSTARASSMPAHAIATGCVDFALPNHRLAAALVALAVAPGGADMFVVSTPAWANLEN